jgi:hypothetical protein
VYGRKGSFTSALAYSLPSRAQSASLTTYYGHNGHSVMYAASWLTEGLQCRIKLGNKSQ